MGYEIESSTRLGYRLVNSPDLILPEEIWSKAKLELLGKNIHYFSSIGSTNEKAKKLAISGAPSRYSCCCRATNKWQGKAREAMGFTE